VAGSRTTNRHPVDRRDRLRQARLYLIVGGPSRERRGAVEAALRSLWSDRVEAAVRGGVEMVQLRWKGAGTAELTAAAIALRQRLRDRALLIVNDDLEAAERSDADGVHLGQGDGSVADARERLGSDRIIGISTHSIAEALAAASGGADYLGCGSMFETRTKPDATLGGPALAGEVSRVVTLPVFAIGGIDARNLAAVLAAGCSRVAVGSAIADASDPESAAREFCDALTGETW
jgi:thiamine-phosphate diphosphorylase